MKAAFFNAVTAVLIVLILVLIPGEGVTEENVSTPEPTRYGVAISGGRTYSPGDINYGAVTGLALFDYEKIWPHRAPEALRFKVEVSAGSTTHPSTVSILSKYH
jgi:lipid A 3-O-deacylase